MTMKTIKRGKKFFELKFVGYGYKGKKLMVRMFVPGMNSGAYDRALHITTHIIENKRTWWGGTKQVISHADMTLNAAAVEQIKLECEKILALPEEKK